MFERLPSSNRMTVFTLLELIYHSTVREIRKTHSNALVGLLLNILQTVLLVIAFYFMFVLIGIRTSPVRGDFLLYIMSGIFIFVVHIKAMGAVLSADGPSSAMMKHAPMNTFVAIVAAALGSLYIQVLSVFIVLLIYHIVFTPITIYDPAGAMGMLLLAWFTGCSIGVLLLALKPWAPDLVGIVAAVYMRVNMIASGKMFLVNTLPANIIAMFDWNPLFHTIDQTRGYVFINYNPHFTNIEYPIYFGIAFLVLGLMGEFYTRKAASLSWEAKR
ncbi:ABC transporter permease [Aestuariibius sp. 2305UL40-4]|uniref:ABC transporter permease n=1 Tax=Aestuariibius violaceus TaxID=3234132 RepID=UPI00345EB18E